MPELQTSLAAANDVAHEVLARMIRKDTVLANTYTNFTGVQKDKRKDQQCTDCGKAFYFGPGHHGKASNCFRCGNPEKARLWNAKSSATNGPWRKPAAVASLPKPAPVVHAVEAPREEAPHREASPVISAAVATVLTAAKLKV